jgi:hypothetical protein
MLVHEIRELVTDYLEREGHLKAGFVLYYNYAEFDNGHALVCLCRVVCSLKRPLCKPGLRQSG